MYVLDHCYHRCNRILLVRNDGGYLLALNRQAKRSEKIANVTLCAWYQPHLSLECKCAWPVRKEVGLTACTHSSHGQRNCHCHFNERFVFPYNHQPFKQLSLTYTQGKAYFKGAPDIFVVHLKIYMILFGINEQKDPNLLSDRALWELCTVRASFCFHSVFMYNCNRTITKLPHQCIPYKTITWTNIDIKTFNADRIQFAIRQCGYHWPCEKDEVLWLCLPRCSVWKHKFQGCVQAKYSSMRITSFIISFGHFMCTDATRCSKNPRFKTVDGKHFAIKPGA